MMITDPKYTLFEERLIEAMRDIYIDIYGDTPGDDPVDPPISGPIIKGYNPSFYSSEEIKFQDSEYLIDIEYPNVLGENVEIIRITDPSWPKWKSDTTYVITPGNYVPFNTLSLENVQGISIYAVDGAVFDFKYSGDLHPYGDNKVSVIENIRINNCDDILLHGLKIKGSAGKDGTGDSNVIYKSDKILLDKCWISNVGATAALRMVDVNGCQIQRSLFNDRPTGYGSDMGGIGFYATLNGGSSNNIICDCEMKNMTDGFGAVIQKGSSPGIVEGSILDNNCIYITSDIYRIINGDEWACAEGGSDIKNGGTALSLITNNRYFGFRPADTSCGGSGSSGYCVVLHRNANNWEIRDNIMLDSINGILAYDGNRKYPEEGVKNILIKNNLMAGIYRLSNFTDSGGFGIRLSNKEVKVEDNTIIGAVNGIWVKPKYSKEVDVSTNVVIASDVDTNSESGNTDFSFWAKRWTGPEQITIKGALHKKADA